MTHTTKETRKEWRVVARPDGSNALAATAKISPYVYPSLTVQYAPFTHENVNMAKAEMFARDVCLKYHIDFEELTSKSRQVDFVHPRQLIGYALSVHSKMTLVGVGKLLGGKHHTTIIHCVKTVKDRMTYDKSYASEVADVVNILRSYK